MLIAGGMLLAVVLSHAQAETTTPAGWKLAWADPFDRDDLGDAWKVVQGQWKLEDGALVGQGTLLSTRGFPGRQRHRTLPGESPPGFHRLEFEVQMVADARADDAVTPAISAFIHTAAYNEKTPPRQVGYAFDISRLAPAQYAIYRNGQQMVSSDDKETRFAADQTHLVVVENDEGRLRLSIDGQLLVEQEEVENLMGEQHDHIGLSFPTVVKIMGVRVYIKQLDDGFF